MKQGFSFSLLLLLLVITVGCDQKSVSPNIILVITDDQGYGDISAHGSPDVFTPNMDLLKSQSVTFEDFQVSPTCAPTRSAILTGRHPFKNAITHTILERERMALGITTLPEVLKRSGYKSGIFGKWHLGDEPEYQPESRGFDEVFIHGAGGIGQAYPGSCADVPDNKYDDPTIKHNGTFVKTKGFCTDVFFTQALSWIKGMSNEQKPFFTYITTNAPHGPFIAPESYKKKFIEKGYSAKAQGYYGMIENIDDNLGMLMEKLKNWGIADNTILIFMSDNGKGMRDGHNGNVAYNAGMKGYKGSIHEGGTRVPFFIRWPEKFAAGKEVQTLFNHYDILPTIAEILDVDISDVKDLDGKSFLAYIESDNIDSDDRYRFVHQGRWPLNPNNINGLEVGKMWIGDEFTSNPDSSQYVRFAVRSEQYRFENNDALYDLFEDPGQTKNIAEENPEIVNQMRQAYDEWWVNVRPYMVNENVPLAKERPFWKAYEAQKESSGIKDWEKPILD
ncbi:arylsulfatase [Portibacter lacus]|uniref:Arylsulfatase n=2 Tax=Portibacter lacus TaxID=1099794 RepID=A0AA37WEH4_9BACT|nr:arylsulfatase [Portibacter lacus]